MLVVTLVRKTSLAQNGSQVGTATASPQTPHQLACPSHAPALPQDAEIVEVCHLRQGLPPTRRGQTTFFPVENHGLHKGLQVSYVAFIHIPLACRELTLGAVAADPPWVTLTGAVDGVTCAVVGAAAAPGTVLAKASTRADCAQGNALRREDIDKYIIY